jgi:hypothetical protein
MIQEPWDIIDWQNALKLVGEIRDFAMFLPIVTQPPPLSSTAPPLPPGSSQAKLDVAQPPPTGASHLHWS